MTRPQASKARRLTAAQRRELGRILRTARDRWATADNGPCTCPGCPQDEQEAS